MLRLICYSRERRERIFSLCKDAAAAAARSWVGSMHSHYSFFFPSFSKQAGQVELIELEQLDITIVKESERGLFVWTEIQGIASHVHVRVLDRRT